MKKEILLAWVCICFMFLSMIISYVYLIRTNRWGKFHSKCEVVNLGHLSMKVLLDNKDGFLLTGQHFYPVKKLVLDNWARMEGSEKVVIITEDAIKELQKNFGLIEKKK